MRGKFSVVKKKRVYEFRVSFLKVFPFFLEAKKRRKKKKRKHKKKKEEEEEEEEEEFLCKLSSPVVEKNKTQKKSGRGVLFARRRFARALWSKEGRLWAF